MGTDAHTQGENQLISQLGNEGMIPRLNSSGSWIKQGLLDECVFPAWMRNLHWLKSVCGKKKNGGSTSKSQTQAETPPHHQVKFKPLIDKPVYSVLSFYLNHDFFSAPFDHHDSFGIGRLERFMHLRHKILKLQDITSASQSTVYTWEKKGQWRTGDDKFKIVYVLIRKKLYIMFSKD